MKHGTGIGTTELYVLPVALPCLCVLYIVCWTRIIIRYWLLLFVLKFCFCSVPIIRPPPRKRKVVFGDSTYRRPCSSFRAGPPTTNWHFLALFPWSDCWQWDFRSPHNPRLEYEILPVLRNLWGLTGWQIDLHNSRSRWDSSLLLWSSANGHFVFLSWNQLAHCESRCCRFNLKKEYCTYALYKTGMWHRFERQFRVALPSSPQFRKSFCNIPTD